MRKPFPDDKGKTRRSVYDPDPLAESDLWFLPGPSDERAPTDPLGNTVRGVAQPFATFMRYPILSAELLADAAGCSRPAARRNLTIFETRGLIQEVTGQERYRFWSARI